MNNKEYKELIEKQKELDSIAERIMLKELDIIAERRKVLDKIRKERLEEAKKPSTSQRLSLKNKRRSRCGK